MKTALELGDEVFVFDHHYIEMNSDITKYIKGKIIEHHLTDDLSQHGSPWYEDVYTVLGEDNKTYICTYGTNLNIISDYFIRTKEDYLEWLKSQVKDNLETIKHLKNKIKVMKIYNDELSRACDKIENDEKEKAIMKTRKSNH